jgi:hypothetical protein
MHSHLSSENINILIICDVPLQNMIKNIQKVEIFRIGKFQVVSRRGYELDDRSSIPGTSKSFSVINDVQTVP